VKINDIINGASVKVNDVIDGEYKTYIKIRTGTVYQSIGPGSNIISYLEKDARIWVGSVSAEVTRAAQTLVGIWETSTELRKLREALPVVEDSDSDNCPSCGHSSVTLSAVKYTFEYGQDDRIVMLTAVVPVFTCGRKDCKLSWLNECGQALIEYAITQYLESQESEVTRVT
jgi:hypothetical protein